MSLAAIHSVVDCLIYPFVLPVDVTPNFSWVLHYPPLLLDACYYANTKLTVCWIYECLCFLIENRNRKQPVVISVTEVFSFRGLPVWRISKLILWWVILSFWKRYLQRWQYFSLSIWLSTLSSFQVLSGCAIIVRGQPRGGPPPERQINLSNIRAGAMARRAAQGQPDTKDTPDEVSSSIPLCLYLFMFVFVWQRQNKVLLNIPSACSMIVLFGGWMLIHVPLFLLWGENLTLEIFARNFAILISITKL